LLGLDAMAIKDFRLTISSVTLLISQLTELLKSSHGKAYRVTITEWREKRSLSQNALYWTIVTEVSTQWDVSDDPEIIHEIFKKYFCPEKVINKHLSIRSTKKLDVGEMHFYLNRIEQFCIDRNFIITIPDNCEYRELMTKQLN
jgi:hypothetical protein